MQNGINVLVYLKRTSLLGSNHVYCVVLLSFQAVPSSQESSQEYILSQNVLSSLGQVAINFGKLQWCLFIKQRKKNSS